MINVLYESLAVPVKLWNLKMQIITVNFSEAVRKLSLIDIPGGEQDHMTHCTHYTNHWFPLVCDLLMSHPKSELHGPELNH